MITRRKNSITKHDQFLFIIQAQMKSSIDIVSQLSVGEMSAFPSEAVIYVYLTSEF
jgi:hypothetical protein